MLINIDNKRLVNLNDITLIVINAMGSNGGPATVAEVHLRCGSIFNVNGVAADLFLSLLAQSSVGAFIDSTAGKVSINPKFSSRPTPPDQKIVIASPVG